MAQALQRMGAEVAIVEGMDHVLPREPRALGEALDEALAAEGVELHFGQHAAAARRDADDYVLAFGMAASCAATACGGHGPPAAHDDLGLERRASDGEVPVDSRMSAGESLWAIGDCCGIWPLTYVGKYQARVAAANILGASGTPTTARCRGWSSPTAGGRGGRNRRRAQRHRRDVAVARTATYMRDYERPGYLTLISDGNHLTGAHACGPEAGEWLQQATLAIRANVPLEVLGDTIQPFPTFSEAFLHALMELKAA